MKIKNLGVAIALVALLSLEVRARAADLFFTNAIGGDFLGSLNWSPNVVPGAADNANFTNPIFPTITWSASRTNNNAIIDGTSGGFQALIGANFWRVTNSFVIGQSAGRTGTVLHVSGELRVTNSAGTAQLIIGKNGKGAYVLNSPTASAIADQLFVTNNTPALTNSQLVLAAGTLTTLHGSVLEPARDLAMGTVSNGVVIWNILGGTNLLTSGSSGDPIVLGQVNGARAIVNVSGAGTTWTNFLGELTVGASAASNFVSVSGGATWASRGCILGLGNSSSGNRISVSGPTSVWNARAGNILPFHFYIGEFGAFNELQVTSGAKVVSDGTTLALASGSSNNLVLVTDPGSVFTNFNEIRLGNASGGGNTIIVSNSATVFSDTLYYAGQPGSTSNGIIVTGPGSALRVLSFATNAPNGNSLSVGGFGFGDYLTISNGGLVTMRAGVEVSRDRVILTVTGSGSVLSNSYTSGGVGMGGAAVTNSRIQILNGGSIVSPVVGAGGTTNLLIVADPGSKIVGSASVGGLHCSLMVSNGGAIFGSFGDIGFSSGAIENVALVTGPGSIWSNSAAVNLGYLGANNSLLISNNARVFEGGLTIGSQPGATNNLLSVSGDLIVTNATQTGSLDVRRGQVDFSAGTLIADRLSLTNGASSIFNFLGGTLNVRTSTVDNTSAFFVGNGASAATLNLLGNGAHSFADGLTIRSNALLAGNGTISGPLTVQTGGTFSVGGSPGSLSCGDLTLGPGSTTVMELNGTAPGTGYDQLNVTGTVNLGSSTLSISLAPGFFPAEGQTFVLLNNDGSDPVSGTFAGLSEGSFLFLGTNKFKISYAGGSGNDVVLTVTNPPAGDRFWINPLGGNYEIAGNWLDNLVPTPADNANFTNTATYKVTWTANATVANAFFNASSGLLTQSVGGFTWSVTNSYIIGQNIGSTATVAQSSGRLRVTNSAGNAVFEVRRGTNRLHAGTLDVDQLVLTNGAGKFEFYAGTLITRGAAITNNSSFNVGTGFSPLFHAIWDVRSGTNVARSGLQIGRDAVLNQLLVTNGASLISYGGYVGFGSTAQSNVAVISGAGSVWDSGIDFDFGGGGTFNQVIVSNSGALFDSDAIIGNGGGSSNTMSVIGAGSLWSNSASLALYGSFNQMIVSDSGKVSSGSSIIDSGATGNSHNTVFINSAGSVWDAGTLYVGSSASFNQLVLSNGAAVLASELDIGFENTSTNNRVVVSAGTLTVTNPVFSAPFDIRRGTNQLNSGLIEADRLLVTNTLGLFEFNGGTLNVRASTVANAQTFFVGDGVNASTMNLLGNGAHSFANGLTLRSNASLVGNGTISGTLTAQTRSLVFPSAANAPATLTVSGNLSLQSNSVLRILLNGTAPGTGYSQLRVTNSTTQITLNSPMLELLIGFTPAIGDTFVILDKQIFFGQSGPGFNGLPQGTIFTNSGFFFRISYSGGDGNDVTITRVPPLPPPVPAIPISSGSYTQDFNTLSSDGSPINLWSNANTLPGWYASQSLSPFAITNYHSDGGGDLTGALYSYGAVNSNERALGSLSSGTPGTLGFGLCFTNDTGHTVSNCTISYTGEQWRCGGNGSVTNALTFWYRLNSSLISDPEPASNAGWIAVTNLNFASPTVLTNAGALDGNQPTNQHAFVAVSASGFSVPAGQNVFFRWLDVNDAGFDQGMAVDNLGISFLPPPPRITAIVFNPTNRFTQLTVQGVANTSYGIEAASNLIYPIFWQRLGSNTADGSGVSQFTDTNAPQFPMRFYRALSF